MATLVLTAVGSAIGGPVGGAIGSIIGQQVDAILFAPKAREGPRLKELDVQTSSYGTQIPAIFGAMRVAGTVIWATDLIERRSKTGGGKGRPSTNAYSYSVNMAVAISSVPVARVGRIWADGNLLRGATGDLKADTEFRFYNGHEDQALDPLMASAEGAGGCPAYRGVAYAIFEDLQLADFGNRIPSLTFEIFERETAVPLNDIFHSASSGAVTGSSMETVTGYAMSGADARAAVSPLLDSFAVTLRAISGQLQLIDNWTPTGSLSSFQAVAVDSGKNHDRPTRTVLPAHAAPYKLTVRHYDPSRDFQIGLQSSERGGSGRNIRNVELPAALDAANAKRISDIGLLQMHRARETLTAHCAIDSDGLNAGQWITDSDGRDYRIDEVEHFRGSTKISARAAVASDFVTASSASSGRSVSAADLTVGQTQITIIDLPVFDTTDPGKSVMGIFANGTGSGWRRAALSVLHGEGLTELGQTALPAVMGSSVTALLPHDPHLLDARNTLDVQLAHTGIEVPPINGSPGLCWIGGEFIRFNAVTPIAAGRYRLSLLQRGCYGTEAAIDGHQASEKFVWLEQSTARLLDEMPLVPGTTTTIEAFGIGDIAPVSATILLQGKAIAPLAPVHVEGVLRADGGVQLSWVRRSRIDFGWRDGVDQGSAENGELYLVALSGATGEIADWTVQAPTLTLSPSMITELTTIAGPVLEFSVRQIGTHLVSATASVAVITSQ